MRTEGAVQYFCGGVGADERHAMKALEVEANLKVLSVTKKRGGYLADATVTVSDGKATRFSGVADGPICLLHLPPGKYKVSARLGDAVRAANVEIGSQAGVLRQLAFEFPAEPWDGIWASDEEKQAARNP